MSEIYILYSNASSLPSIVIQVIQIIKTLSRCPYAIQEKQEKLRLLLLGSKEGDPWSWASGEKQDLGVLRLGRSQSTGSNVGKG